MSSTPAPPRPTFWLWPTIIVAGLVATLLLPGGFVSTARTVLHGLCAQTPDHTFVIGGHMLPFDARMTGIYTGALAGLIVLAALHRFLHQQLPPVSVLVLLAIGFLSMALDGTNSLLTDLGFWHPWETTNSTRLVTGYLAGVAMAVALVWLIAGTLWHLAENKPVVQTPKEYAYMLVPLPIVWLLVEQGLGWMYVPVSLLLMLSAWIVLALLATSAVLLVTRWDDRIMHIGQVHVPGALGLVIGLGIALALAFGRAWLERTLGIPSTL